MPASPVIDDDVLQTLEKLPEQAGTGKLRAILLSYSVPDQELYSFIIAPRQLQFTGSVTYTEPKAYYDTLGRIKFQHTSPLEISFSDVLVMTECYAYDVSPLLKRLDDLRYPLEPESLSPPPLSLTIGGRSILPLVLTQLSWTETITDGGTVEARVNATFKGFERVRF